MDFNPRVEKTFPPTGNLCRETEGTPCLPFIRLTEKCRGASWEAAVGTAVEAAKLLSSYGGDIRFYVAGAAGEDVDGTLFTQEYESPEALAEALDALANNAELQALLNRLNAPGSPTMITSQSMGMEVPIGRTPKAGRGSILEVHTSHINPGRTEDAIAEAVEVCDFVEANGAINARLLQLTYAGMASGLMAFTFERGDIPGARARAEHGVVRHCRHGYSDRKCMSAAPATPRVMSKAFYNEVPL